MVQWPGAPAPRVNTRARSRSLRRSRQQQSGSDDDDVWGHWRAPPATGVPAARSEGLVINIQPHPKRLPQPRPKRLPDACRKLANRATARAAKNSKKQELDVSEDDSGVRAALAQARELAGLPPVPWGGQHPWCVNGLKSKLMSRDGSANYQMVKLREGKPTYFCMMCWFDQPNEVQRDTPSEMDVVDNFGFETWREAYWGAAWRRIVKEKKPSVDYKAEDKQEDEAQDGDLEDYSDSDSRRCARWDPYHDQSKGDPSILPDPAPPQQGEDADAGGDAAVQAAVQAEAQSYYQDHYQSYHYQDQSASADAETETPPAGAQTETPPAGASAAAEAKAPPAGALAAAKAKARPAGALAGTAVAKAKASPAGASAPPAGAPPTYFILPHYRAFLQCVALGRRISHVRYSAPPL